MDHGITTAVDLDDDDTDDDEPINLVLQNGIVSSRVAKTAVVTATAVAEEPKRAANTAKVPEETAEETKDEPVSLQSHIDRSKNTDSPSVSKTVAITAAPARSSQSKS